MDFDPNYKDYRMLNVRMEDEQLEKVKAAAKESGLDLDEYIIRALHDQEVFDRKVEARVRLARDEGRLAEMDDPELSRLMAELESKEHVEAEARGKIRDAIDAIEKPDPTESMSDADYYAHLNRMKEMQQQRTQGAIAPRGVDLGKAISK